MRILLVFILSYATVAAQTTLSLGDCLALAKEKNLTLQTAQLDMQLAEYQVKNAKMRFLPSLNGNVQFGKQFGLSLNPTTNQLEQRNSDFGTLSLSSSLTLFNGGVIKNSLKSSQLQKEQALANYNQSVNDVALQLVNQYLTILLADEQLQITKTNLQESNNRLQRAQQMVASGTMASGELAQLEAQIALDEQDSIIQLNNYENAILGLKNMLLIDEKEVIQVEAPSLEADLSAEIPAFETVYAMALNTQAGVEAAQKSVENQEVQRDIANAQRMPSLVMFGNVDSRYSSAALDFTNPDLSGVSIVPQEQPVLINGEEALLTQFSTSGVSFPRTPLNNQINDNLGQSVGLVARIPIFNNFDNLLSVQRAEIEYERATIQANQLTQQLKTDVLQALTNCKANQKRLIAAQKSLDANNMALQMAQKRFDQGLLDVFAFSTARANLLNAQTNFTVAKYNYVLSLKIIDLYMGKTLTFE